MRRCLSSSNFSAGSFNPRICKRCDNFLLSRFQDLIAVSIHASVKDATLQEVLDTLTFAVSIHASVKDATSLSAVFGGVFIVSIHASVKDATLSLPNPFFLHACFNPRICKRCDVAWIYYHPHHMVSIHASVKDATPAMLAKLAGGMFQSTHL